MSKGEINKPEYNSGAFSVFSSADFEKALTTGKVNLDTKTDAYDEDERDLKALKFANLNDAKYDNARNFIEALYAGTDVTFEYFMRDKNGIVQRSIPNATPEISAMVTDWDGTVGNLYEKHAYAVWTLLDHISETRKIDFRFLQDYLKEGGKTEEYFSSYDFFSVEGMEKILKSKHFSSEHPQTGLPYTRDFAAEDADFIEKTLKPAMEAAYSHVYGDAIVLFKELRAQGVPVFVHTDSPFSELVDKLIAVSDSPYIRDEDKPIKFKKDNKGNIIGVERSDFVGFSVLYNLTPEQENDAKISSVVKALKSYGIDIIKNNFDERKPNPEPLAKIIASLKKMGYGDVKPSEMLMVGDILSKDGAFALQNDMYYAWPGHKAKLSEMAVAINRITAAGNPMHKNRILGQIRPFADRYLKDSPENMERICKTMAVCRSYKDLMSIFNFRGRDIQDTKNKENPLVSSNRIYKKGTMDVVSFLLCCGQNTNDDR